MNWIRLHLFDFCAKPVFLSQKAYTNKSRRSQNFNKQNPFNLEFDSWRKWGDGEGGAVLSGLGRPLVRFAFSTSQKPDIFSSLTMWHRPQQESVEVPRDNYRVWNFGGVQWVCTIHGRVNSHTVRQNLRLFCVRKTNATLFFTRFKYFGLKAKTTIKSNGHSRREK